MSTARAGPSKRRTRTMGTSVYYVQILCYRKRSIHQTSDGVERLFSRTYVLHSERDNLSTIPRQSPYM
jgi:hypothetical protein